MPKRVSGPERAGKAASSATRKRGRPTPAPGSRSRSIKGQPSSGSSAKKSSVATTASPTPQLGADFVDLLSAFSRARVRFLVIGGYAVGVHGHPRATKDLDVWVEPTAENSVRVLSALRAFGAPLAGVSATDLTDPDGVFQIGVVPNRVNLLCAIPGVAFAACWRRRARIVFGGVETPVISKTDLIANKRATGRLQGLADVEALTLVG